MGDEPESDDEPSQQPDGTDEPTEKSTESADTTPVEPVDEDTSGDDDESPESDESAAETGGFESVADKAVAGNRGSATDTDDDADADADDDADADADDDADADADDDADADTDDADLEDADADSDSADGVVANEMPDGFDPDLSHLEDDDEPFDDDFDHPDDEPFEDDLDDGLLEGPDSDQEMPLADHIEEMVRRLAVVFILGGGVALSVFGLGEVLQYVPSTVDIINFLWNSHIPGAGLPGNEDLRPHVYGPLELILTKLKVAGLVGVVVGLPVFVYESYLFMRPGLYQKERKYYLASVPTSLILAVIGVAFAHFVVLPSIFAYFTSYTEGTALIAFGLAETFNLILILMGYMAIVFQIPLFIMLAIMMNLVTRKWLENKRLLFWGAFLGLAFLVSPDPTGMAPIIIAITMVSLFEGTLALLRWTGN